MRAIPVIIAVRFVVDGSDVVFTFNPVEGLTRAVSNAVVAFETDEIGDGHQSSWEVHVTGVARALPATADGPFFRLATDVISGTSASG
jgi:hypothetical protein